MWELAGFTALSHCETILQFSSNACNPTYCYLYGCSEAAMPDVPCWAAGVRAKNKLLIDCALRLDVAADYKSVVYGFSSAGALNSFIEDPSPFLGPLPELMPRKLTTVPPAVGPPEGCIVAMAMAERL